jgi:hypothetical protein
MGLFYNEITKRWNEIDHEMEETDADRTRVRRRKALIKELIAEIRDPNDSISLLYAELLARQIVQSSRFLMKDYGKQIVELTNAREITQMGGA